MTYTFFLRHWSVSHYPELMLTFFAATADILPLGIHKGDTVSVDATNPDEPVVIHHPAVGVTVERLATAIGTGALERVSQSVSRSAAPPVPETPVARPRLRLLRGADQQMA